MIEFIKYLFYKIFTTDKQKTERARRWLSAHGINGPEDVTWPELPNTEKGEIYPNTGKGEIKPNISPIPGHYAVSK